MVVEQVSAVDRIYEELKSQAIAFAIKPGMRLNETEIARSLGVSRTPLREALNRLAATGFLSFAPSQGYFRKSLDANEIFNLYEMRQVIEIASVRLAADRAQSGDLNHLEAFLMESVQATEAQGVEQLVRFDELFHERIVKLTGNCEMLAALRNVNDRIRFVRWIDMEHERRRNTQNEHLRILQALRDGDGDRAAETLEKHIALRMDQINAHVREGYARIYVDGHPGDGRRLEPA